MYYSFNFKVNFIKAWLTAIFRRNLQTITRNHDGNKNLYIANKTRFTNLKKKDS